MATSSHAWGRQAGHREADRESGLGVAQHRGGIGSSDALESGWVAVPLAATAPSGQSSICRALRMNSNNRHPSNNRRQGGCKPSAWDRADGRASREREGTSRF